MITQRFEYKLLATHDREVFQQKIDALAECGFQIIQSNMCAGAIAGIPTEEFFAVLERPVEVPVLKEAIDGEGI